MPIEGFQKEENWNFRDIHAHIKMLKKSIKSHLDSDNDSDWQIYQESGIWSDKTTQLDKALVPEKLIVKNLKL